jgi:hypothetical protein
VDDLRVSLSPLFLCPSPFPPCRFVHAQPRVRSPPLIQTPAFFFSIESLTLCTLCRTHGA